MRRQEAEKLAADYKITSESSNGNLFSPFFNHNLNNGHNHKME